jgi:glycosyltransferase involved in cell wall biosynthesis
MKIILATSLYPPEIAEPAPYVKKLALLLKDRHEIKVITYANEIEEQENVQVIKIKKQRFLLWRLINFTFVLFKISKKANLIFVQNSISVSLPSILIKKLRRLPLVLRFMEDESWERSQYLALNEEELESYLKKPKNNFKINLIKFLQTYVLKKADTIITPSLEIKNIISKAYKINPQKIILNYNPASFPQILNFENKKENFRIIVKSPLLKYSNIAGILKAIAKTKEEYKNIKLIIIGKGEEKNNLKILVEKFNLKKQVKFLGTVSRAESEYLIKNSSALIINSNEAHDPDLILKSFTLMSPIIASNINLHKEIIKNNYNGILIKKNSSEELSKAIKEIFKNPELAKNISLQAQVDFKNRYSWNNHLQILFEIFKNYEK